MSMLLALDATQIVLIVLIGLLVVSYPLLMLFRNKKQTQRITEQTNSLKRGDKILTSTGIYGKIVDIKMDGTSKQVTIETGTDKYKSYMTIDAYAIYQVLPDETRVAKDLPQATALKEENKEAPAAAQKAEKAKAEKATPEAAVSADSTNSEAIIAATSKEDKSKSETAISTNNPNSEAVTAPRRGRKPKAETAAAAITNSAEKKANTNKTAESASKAKSSTESKKAEATIAANKKAASTPARAKATPKTPRKSSK